VPIAFAAWTVALSACTLAAALRLRRAQRLPLQRRGGNRLVLAAALLVLAEAARALQQMSPSPGLAAAEGLARVAFLVALARSLLLDARSQTREVEPLRRSAEMDALTGAYNAGAFRRLAEGCMADALGRGTPLAVLMLDVDDFKSYNDAHGHEAGNQALRRVGELLRASTREGDLVGRYGGEEFAVLVRGDLAAALLTAERVRDTIEAACTPARDAALRRRLTVSVGVAALQAPDDDLACLLERADWHLYQAKRRGKNQVSPAPPSPRALLERQHAEARKRTTV
jgi:diguanylate cyclase (GGDEF)-like protein